MCKPSQGFHGCNDGPDRAVLAELADAPATATERPSDEEILELMPQRMREDLAAATRAMAAQAGIDSRSGMGAMRIILNRHAVDLALAVLARWGNHSPGATKMVPPAEGEVAELVADLQECADSCILSSKPYWAAPMRRAAELLERQAAPVPVAVSERLPGPEDCTAQGWCWVFYRGFAAWTLEPPLGQDGKHTGYTHWLPAHALPLPAQAGEVQP